MKTQDGNLMHQRVNGGKLRNVIRFLLCLALFGAAPGRAEETDQLTALTVEQAKTLAQDKSGRLLLDGLKSLSPEVAAELAKCEGWLSLNGLTALSDEAAAAIANEAEREIFFEDFESGD